MNSRLLSGLWKTLWNELRHRAIYILRIVPAKISRAPLRHGGARSQTENWNYQCGFVGFQTGMQKANIPAVKIKSWEQQQQNRQGSLLGTVPFPFCIPLVWMNIAHCCMVGFFAAWRLCCLVVGCWCIQVAAIHWEWQSSNKWGYPPVFELCYSTDISLSGGTGGQEEKGLNPRSWGFFRAQNRMLCKGKRFKILFNFSLKISKHYMEKKITVLRKHLRIATNMKGYGIYRMHTE